MPLYSTPSAYAADPAFTGTYGLVATANNVAGSRQFTRRTISSMVTALQSGHGYTGAGTGATWSVNDTADYCWGTQSAKVVTGGNGAACNLSKLGQTAFSIVGKLLMVPVKVSSVANLSTLILYLGSSSLTNYYQISLTPGSVGSECAWKDNEWFPLIIDISEAVTSGTPDPANITDVRWTVRDGNSTPITVNIQGLALTPDSSGKFANGVVTFSMDDGYAAQWSLIRPVLDAAGVPATLHVIADRIGSSSDFVTLAQLKAMRDLSGFEIGGHTYYYDNHQGGGYPAKSLAVVEDDLRKLRDFLASNGFNGMDFAYPGGLYTPEIEELVLRYFNSARVVFAGPPREFVPPNRIGRMRPVSLIPSKSLASAQADVDRAYTHKQWLNFCLHDMSTGSPTGNQWRQSDLVSLLAYIQAKPMPVVTTEDVLRA